MFPFTGDPFPNIESAWSVVHEIQGQLPSNEVCTNIEDLQSKPSLPKSHVHEIVGEADTIGECEDFKPPHDKSLYCSKKYEGDDEDGKLKYFLF